MGCCISKCRVKKHFIEECNHVQDKLVISQAPKIPITQSNKISPCPLSPIGGVASMSSISSFTCTNSNTVSSCSSLSIGSSVLTSKDRSFSNEFLWSRVRENPHIIGINSIKERAQSLVTPNVHIPPKKLDSSIKQQVAPPPKQSTPPRVNGSTPQKRLRQNSQTTLVSRQKSFRREPAERVNNHISHSLPGRTLRSPSPSRRYNGDIGRGISAITAKEAHSKCVVGPKVSAANSVASALRTENLRLASSYMESSHLRQCPWLRNRARAETCIHRISSKIDENAVQEAMAHYDGDPAALQMEDIDNPLISLDCFIFV